MPDKRLQAHPKPAAAPTVWILLGKGTGGNGQMLSLAEALGWPCQTKRLVYNPLNLCPNLVLGASLLSLNRRRSDPLVPPWPDLVIGASRRSAPVARWIQRQSGGRARLAHLLHTQAPLDAFDLIITLPQYRLPQRPNVLHATAALNRIDPARLTAAAAQWAPRFAALPRPYTALLVGGDSSSYKLDAATAVRLGRELGARIRADGGSVLVSTSPRTPEPAAAALFAALDCPSYCYRWRPNDPDNPHLGCLALADNFIVTADSASLLVEACAAGKPVALFEWPPRWRARWGIKPLLQRWSETHEDPLARLYRRWVYLGLIKPPRDLSAYHRALKARGLITTLGETANPIPRRPLDDMERAVARIHQLRS